MNFRLSAALVLSTATALFAQFSSVPGQGRSMVVTKYGIVAAPQFLASQAGARVLEAGGNAVDAAIAANAVLGDAALRERNGRRSFRDRLRGEDRKIVRPECQRLVSGGADHRVFEGPQHH